MDYNKIYWKLINRAVERDYPESDEYERHHIIPRSEGRL